MMDPEIKAKWLAALRSGEYKQCQGGLKVDGRYCCLGVLCVVQGETFVGLNDAVLHTSDIPKKFSAGLSTMDQYNLADLNDEGVSFAEIADVIEANY